MRKKAVRFIASVVAGFVFGLAISVALELFEISGFFYTIALIILALAAVQLILFFKAF